MLGAADGRLHVAIIMDGNGRWAQASAACRARSAIGPASRPCADRGGRRRIWAVERLTVFGFSTENWSRPPAEVTELMALLKALFRQRPRPAGARGRARAHHRPPQRPVARHPARSSSAPRRARRPTTDFYPAGRLQLWRPADIVDAARQFAQEVLDGQANPGDLDESAFESRLSTAGASAARPDRAHQRRAAAVQLPAVGRRLRRARLPGCLWPDYGPST